MKTEPKSHTRSRGGFLRPLLLAVALLAAGIWVLHPVAHAEAHADHCPVCFLVQSGSGGALAPEPPVLAASAPAEVPCDPPSAVATPPAAPRDRATAPRAPPAILS